MVGCCVLCCSFADNKRGPLSNKTWRGSKRSSCIVCNFVALSLLASVLNATLLVDGARVKGKGLELVHSL